VLRSSSRWLSVQAAVISRARRTRSLSSAASCSERKVRCDKLNPCSTCTATGATCNPVYRKRRPRGRHAKSLGAENKDLHQRLARLEELVANQIPTEPLTLSSSATTPCSQITTTSSVSGTNRTASPRYIANGFWVDLVDTVSTLPSFAESTHSHRWSLSRKWRWQADCLICLAASRSDRFVHKDIGVGC
jgi:hypothetical protein